MTEGVDYFVRLVRYPNNSTPGQVWQNDDDTFDIYIDERLSDADRATVLAHELRHIERGHFGSLLPIRAIECEADGKSISIFNIDGIIPEFKSLEHFQHYINNLEGRLSNDLSKMPQR